MAAVQWPPVPLADWRQAQSTWAALAVGAVALVAAVPAVEVASRPVPLDRPAPEARVTPVPRERLAKLVAPEPAVVRRQLRVLRLPRLAVELPQLVAVVQLQVVQLQVAQLEAVLLQLVVELQPAARPQPQARWVLG